MLSTRFGEKGAHIALVMLCLLWAGMLAAISFTEAWVKFKTKMLERHVALDVGRNVFDALNSLESACAVVLVGLKLAVFPHMYFPVDLLVVLVMLASQVMYLSSALELRAIYTIRDILANKSRATKLDEEVYKECTAITTMSTMPPILLHHAYVGMEIFKFTLLIKTATESLLLLAGVDAVTAGAGPGGGGEGL